MPDTNSFWLDGTRLMVGKSLMLAVEKRPCRNGSAIIAKLGPVPWPRVATLNRHGAGQKLRSAISDHRYLERMRRYRQRGRPEKGKRD